MARSVWKGPFVDSYLLKKAEVAQASGRNDVIKIWSRRSTILPQFVGLTLGSITARNIFRLLYQKIWLAINLVNLRLPVLITVMPQIKKQSDR